MKKVFLLALICVLAFGAAALWAGDANTDNMSVTNIAKRSMAYIPGAANQIDKSAIYGNTHYVPVGLDIEVTGDDCSDPFVITTFPYTDTRDNSTFLDDYGLSGPDVVYEFTIPTCKDVTISLCNSPDITLDLYLEVFANGDCGGTAIAYDDDFCSPSPVYGTPQLTARLQAGTYYFIVDAYGSAIGTYTVDVTTADCPAPPPFDNCVDVDPANFLLTNGGTLQFTGDNTGATLDPDCDSLTTEQTWIAFHTTELLDIKIDFCGTDPVRGGYYRVMSPSCPCPIDFYFALNEDTLNCADHNPTLYFNRVPAGDWYYPVIGGTSEGPYDVLITGAPPTGLCDFTCPGGTTPEGEACGADLNGGCNSAPPAFGSVTCGEHICGEVFGDGGTRDTDWFEYIPATDTFITWSASGAVPLAVILIDFTDGCGETEYVYLGGGGAPECDTAAVTAFVQAGHNIACFVSTDAIYSGYPCIDGPFYYEAWLNCISPGVPANNDCADAIEIGDVTGYAWTNLGATTDNSGACDPALQADVWYRYTASCNGVATLDLCDGTAFDSFIGIFEDDCVAGACLAFNDDGCGVGGGPSIVSWPVAAGTAYLLCLGGWSGSMGSGAFDVSCAPAAIINVSPSTVSGTAPEGGSDTEVLTVSNTGGGALEFTAYTTQDFPTVAAGNNSGDHATINNTPQPSRAPLTNNKAVTKGAPASPSQPVMQKDVMKVVDLRKNVADQDAIQQMYCDVVMTGPNVYVFGGFDTTDELAVYQDPSIACEANPYPFQVDSLNIAVSNGATVEEEIFFYVALYEADLTDPACPKPGTFITATPVYSYVFPAGSFYGFTLEAPVNTCVTGPFFMSIGFPADQTLSRVGITGIGLNIPCYTWYTYEGMGDWATLEDATGYAVDLSLYYYASGRTQTCETEFCDIECPTGGIAEGETCVENVPDVTNGGCNSDPDIFGAIACNTTICGNVWANGGSRDTDWFNFTLTDPTYIRITLMPEFPAACYLLDASDCNNILAYALISVPTCDTGTISGALPAGTYTIFVAPSLPTNEGILCDLSGIYYNEYVLSLDCMPAWLDVDTYEGTAPPSVPVTVLMDAANLTEGTYTGSVVFESNDLSNPMVTVPVTFVVTAGGGCFQYLPGDANMYIGLWPPTVINGDVTYLVNFFRNLPSNPFCKLDGLYCAADVNGDCRVIGSDVTRLVSFFRGIAIIAFCPDYEPCWHNSGELPPSAPAGWPNCETAPVVNKVVPGSSSSK